MNILIVEDDVDKREQLINFVNENLEIDSLTEVRSFQSGLKAIMSSRFDLILLDMTMPTFDIQPTEYGGRSQPFGGELLLFEMLRRGIKSKVVVVSQFDLFGEGDSAITLTDLDSRLKEKFLDNYVGAVQYHISYTGWNKVLIDKIREAGFKF